ncbi:MAG: tRNA (adenosine(37)-N6)-dimethylallyltransferase MiaA, partial [Oscillospiraceae bacterium]|nr:tRNA (adenosine(37)-N6)-dimethylallyltransferase MiaA [Oscillospiraceae bacterium]
LVKSREIPSRFKPIMIGLNFKNRDNLYDRINKRVDIMVKDGLLDEALAVYKSKGLKTAHQAIGYKELYCYFNGEKTLDEALEQLKMSTRRYAKRQLTWFRRDSRINWIYADSEGSFENILKKAKEVMEKYSNL